MIGVKVGWLLAGLVCLGLAAVAYLSFQDGRWKYYKVAGEAAYQQGNYAEAERQFVAALKEAERFDREDPRLATSLNNLAAVYKAQGRDAEAEPLYKHALAIDEKILGPDHPSFARDLNNLAELYRIQGRYAKSEPLIKRSLAILEVAFGSDHPDLAFVLNNLALLYLAQSRYAEAEPLFKRALAIMEKAFGPGHPHVAVSMENYAALLRETGRNTEAIKMEARVKAIRAMHAMENLAN